MPKRWSLVLPLAALIVIGLLITGGVAIHRAGWFCQSEDLRGVFQPERKIERLRPCLSAASLQSLPTAHDGQKPWRRAFHQTSHANLNPKRYAWGILAPPNRNSFPGCYGSLPEDRHASPLASNSLLLDVFLKNGPAPQTRFIVAPQTSS